MSEALATAADVRAINEFPKVTSDLVLDDFIAQVSGELRLPFLMLGVTFPITAPQEIVDALRKAASYGAAAMVELKHPSGSSPEMAQAAYQIYQGEYERLLSWFRTFSREQLILLGVIEAPIEDSVVLLNYGLKMVGNRSIQPTVSFMDRYPFRLLREGEDY